MGTAGLVTVLALIAVCAVLYGRTFRREWIANVRRLEKLEHRLVHLRSRHRRLKRQNRLLRARAARV